jgi:hypothetical protein
VWLWQEKRLAFQSLKDSEKNNKEIKKLPLLFNNKDNKEELLTKPENNKSPPEPNNMKLNTKPIKLLKSTPEDKFFFPLSL